MSPEDERYEALIRAEATLLGLRGDVPEEIAPILGDLPGQLAPLLSWSVDVQDRIPGAVGWTASALRACARLLEESAGAVERPEEQT